MRRRIIRHTHVITRITRPVRTRSHHIADLSRNHVERYALRCGYTVEGRLYDYGYDLVLCTYDYQDDAEFTNGEVENGEVFLQLKATDKLTLRKDGQTISFPIERRHIELWRGELMPVILILYEVESETAYWLYVQSYCHESTFRMPPVEQKEVTLFVPKKNLLNEEVIRRFRQYKEDVLNQVRTNVKNIHRREEGRA